MPDSLPLIAYAEAARNRALRQVEQNNEEWFRLALLQIEKSLESGKASRK